MVILPFMHVDTEAWEIDFWTVTSLFVIIWNLVIIPNLSLGPIVKS